MKNICLTTASVLFMFLCSCEKEKHTPAAVPLSRGIFIVNEGAFGQANGSVSFLADNGSFFAPDIFRQVNGYPLGDIVQSMYIYNSTAYIVVNNSKKIEVVNMSDFSRITTVSGFDSPRYFLPVSADKAYVSDWQSNSIKIMDLTNNSVTGSINAGNGPEQMLRLGNKVYVVNVGGFGSDSTVTVIDAQNDLVIKTIAAGINPNSIVADASGNAVVLCGGSTGPDFTGGTADDIAGSVMKIDPVTDSVIYFRQFDQYFHPLKMNTNATHDRFLMLVGNDNYTGKVAEFNFTTGTTTILIDEFFYGLGVHPVNGNIYCGRAGFTSNNYVVRLTSTGSIIDSLLCGIAPNSFQFFY